MFYGDFLCLFMFLFVRFVVIVLIVCRSFLMLILLCVWFVVLNRCSGR